MFGIHVNRSGCKYYRKVSNSQTDIYYNEFLGKFLIFQIPDSSYL